MAQMRPVSCPRGHGLLASVVPETLDGSQSPVGFCQTCKGLWVPHDLVRSLITQDLLDDLVWAPAAKEACMDCSCGRFPGQGTFRSQRIGAGGPVHTDAELAEVVTIDRCDQCACLWLDSGEVAGLGGKDSIRVVSERFEVSEAVLVSYGMGGDPNDRLKEVQIDGAQVQIWYDDEPEPGAPTRFSWRGELVESEVRGTVGRETRARRLLRSVGIADIEVGHAEFDAEFCIVSSDEAAMQGWLQRHEVREALWTVRRRAGGIVSIWREGFEVTGWLADDAAVPDAQLEAACEALYRSLR